MGVLRVRLLLFAVMLGCAGPSVIVTRMAEGATLPAASPGYPDVATAIQQAAFGHLAGRTDLDAEERDLVAALGHVEAGRFPEAERALGRLADAGSEVIPLRSRIARSWILADQGRWSEALASCGDLRMFAGVAPLYRAWAGAPPERVTFTAPSATIPASLGDVRLPLIHVHLCDRQWTFLVDTGASFSLISTDLAEALGVTAAGEASDIGTGTSRSLAVRPAVLPRLVVGNAVFENHPCLVADGGDMTFTFMLFSSLKIDGVFGWSAIRRLDIEIDFRVPEVTIREPKPRVVATRNLFWLGTPLVRGNLADGLPILSDLDTGATCSHLYPVFFRSLPEAYWKKVVGKTREGRVNIWSAGGHESVRTRTAERLSIVVDRHVIEFDEIESFGRSKAAIFVPLVCLGSDIARQGRMRIDFANGAFELGR